MHIPHTISTAKANMYKITLHTEKKSTRKKSDQNVNSDFSRIWKPDGLVFFFFPTMF